MEQQIKKRTKKNTLLLAHTGNAKSKHVRVCFFFRSLKNIQTSMQTTHHKTIRATKTFNTPISVKNKFLHYFVANKAKKYKGGNCK